MSIWACQPDARLWTRISPMTTHKLASTACHQMCLPLSQCDTRNCTRIKGQVIALNAITKNDAIVGHLRRNDKFLPGLNLTKNERGLGGARDERFTHGKPQVSRLPAERDLL